MSFCYSSFLLEERCRFLSAFSITTADVELPGEFLMPKPNMVRIDTILTVIKTFHLMTSYIMLSPHPHVNFTPVLLVRHSFYSTTNRLVEKKWFMLVAKKW